MSFEDSLEAAGFFPDGFQWTHAEHGITVIEGAGKDGLPYVMANGVADKDMEAWLGSLDFQTGYLDFGGASVYGSRTTFHEQQQGRAETQLQGS